VAGSCEYGNELPGPIKHGEFLDHVREYWLLNDERTGSNQYSRCSGIQERKPVGGWVPVNRAERLKTKNLILLSEFP